MVLPSPFSHHHRRSLFYRHSRLSFFRRSNNNKRFQIVICCSIVGILISLKLIFLSSGSGEDLYQNYTLLLPSPSSSSASSESFFQQQQQQQETKKTTSKSNLAPPVVIQKGKGKERSTTTTVSGRQKRGGDDNDSSHHQEEVIKKKQTQQQQQQQNSIIPPKIILPEACRRRINQLSSSSSSSNNNPTTSQQQQQPVQQQKQRFIKDIYSTDDIPSKYIYNRPILNYKPMSLIMYDNITQKVNYNNNLKILPTSFEKSLPTNTTIICIPYGIIVDNGIAGPYYYNRPDNDNPIDPDNDHPDPDDPPINIYQSKEWYAPNINKFINKKPTVVDVPGLGVQLSSWTGFTHNHWPLDTLIRLGLVYDALVNGDDPLWRNAKIVVSSSNTLDNIEGDRSSRKEYYDRSNGIAVDPPISWLYDKLNLTHRLIPSNGWLAKANTTTRFDLLVLPDITPQPKCGGNVKVKDPIFPRGTLLPIQRALGLLTNPETTTETTETTTTKKPKYIVFASRESAHRRAVNKKHRKLIITSLEQMLVDMNLTAEDYKVIEWSYTNADERCNIMSQTIITIGPHGANLWNVAFMKPGGLLVEYNTFQDEFTNKDCRTCGFSLANAASLDYALIETSNFGYEKTNFKPPIHDTIEIVKSFLINKKR